MIREAYEHHIFLSPSVTAADGATEGGAPVSIIEMSASGMLVVSSRHCDIPNVILDGETGWLAGERDVNGLTECLRRATADPGKWPAMQQAARQRVEREFNAVVQGRRLAEIYEQAAQ